MPQVRYIGKSLSYTAGSYRFSKENEYTVDIPAEHVEPLLDKRDFKNRPLFEVVEG